LSGAHDRQEARGQKSLKALKGQSTTDLEVQRTHEPLIELGSRQKKVRWSLLETSAHR
jgi:hypothetical protein